MKITPFAVEEWMNEYEVGAKYNIAETCVDSISPDALFQLTKTDKQAFLDELCARRFTYGDIVGRPDLRNGIASLYKTVVPDEIVMCHGASGANHHVFYSLIEPGDEVVTVLPTYQQLYSIPESLGAVVKTVMLKKEDNFQLDMNALKEAVTAKTKLICLNNPNNPTGALLSEDALKEVVALAQSVGAYLLCDEVYRHLTQTDEWSPSIVDLYDKGISVSSMSKVFSLAGLRLGWIVSHDAAFIKSCFSHRDYTLISCGMFDEALAALALTHKDALLLRNRQLVRENLAILDDWVQQEPLVSYVKPQAGTTALVFYEGEEDSYEFCKNMYNKTGAFVTPGDCFGMKKCMRIGYASDKETLIEGLKAISEYLHR